MILPNSVLPLETLRNYTLLTQSPLPLSAPVGRSWEMTTQKVMIMGWEMKQQWDKKKNGKSNNTISESIQKRGWMRDARDNEQCQIMPPHISTKSHTLLLGSQGVPLSTPSVSWGGITEPPSAGQNWDKNTFLFLLNTELWHLSNKNFHQFFTTLESSDGRRHGWN